MGLSGLFKRKGKPDLPEGETRQTGDGVNITAGKVEAEQIIGTQNVYHLPEPGAPLAPLPDLPPEGELPPAQDALPPGSSMQLIRNHIFTGREADLHIVAHNLLYSGGAGRVGISQRAGVWGLGGIGKTQLAAEFCYRYGRFFEGVHWIAAGQPEGIEAQIAACGARMGLKPWPEGVPEQAERTLAEWEQSRRRLVVLDNLEEPDALRQWLPRFACVKLLITTRRAHWSPELGLDLHAIDVLPRSEGRALLRRPAARLASAPDADLDALLDLLAICPRRWTWRGATWQKEAACRSKNTWKSWTGRRTCWNTAPSPKEWTLPPRWQPPFTCRGSGWAAKAGCTAWRAGSSSLPGGARPTCPSRLNCCARQLKTKETRRKFTGR